MKSTNIFIIYSENAKPVRIRGERSAKSYVSWKGLINAVVLPEAECMAAIRTKNLTKDEHA